MKTIIAIACALLVSGCWDMDAASWKHAEEMCATHGGVLLADRDFRNGGKGLGFVTALCADNIKVEKFWKESP